ncbi:MAG: flagellar hook protein FlgE [Candidatus Wenzhouxiangella sp. M2_3B_020]
MIRSLRTGVSGLKANQVRMDVVSNNISNVNTVAFKRSRAAFNEVLGQQMLGVGRTAGGTGINPSFVGLGVNVGSIDQNWSQGSLENTGVATDLALNGDGFFIAKAGDRTLLTRAGNFTFNRDGEFVTSNGLNVQGWSYGEDGKLVTGGVEDVRINPNAQAPAKRTENVFVGGNLSADAQIGDMKSVSSVVYDAQGQPRTVIIDYERVTTSGEFGATEDTWRYTVKDEEGNPLIDGTAGASYDVSSPILSNWSGDSAVPTVAANATPPTESGTYEFSVESYDSVADEYTVTLGDGSTATVAGGASTTVTSNGIDVTFDLSGGETLTVGDSFSVHTRDAASVGGTMTFDANGSMVATNPNADGEQIHQFNWDIDGTGTSEPFTLNFGNPDESGLTQYSGSTTATVREQDGQASGTLAGYSIDPDGVLQLNFSNGEQQKLFKLAIGNVNNPNGLEQQGENFYTTSAASGDLQLGQAGRELSTAVVAGTLEMSNVELSKEFTEMIVAQRGYQASARVITTSDQILQETMQLKR